MVYAIQHTTVLKQLPVITLKRAKLHLMKFTITCTCTIKLRLIDPIQKQGQRQPKKIKITKKLSRCQVTDYST